MNAAPTKPSSSRVSSRPMEAEKALVNPASISRKCWLARHGVPSSADAYGSAIHLGERVFAGRHQKLWRKPSQW
jgi:hypothetical protein